MSMTPSQTVGPFFHFGLTDKNSVDCIAGREAKGERIWLKVHVFDGDGALVDDGMLELWQADAEGRYNHPADPGRAEADPACSGFGRLATGGDGSCQFETIRPGRVPGPSNIRQAPHLNLAVFARGMLKQLYTRVYFANDPANSEDSVLASVPEDRRQTLLAQPDSDRQGAWRFAVHLQGDGETVFFDV
jgi:protocatechuate 3,4-dioxygenase alpha subunit